MSKRVLLVEDEPLLRKLIARVLERNDFTVVSVEDGDSAIQALETQQRFDIALVDVNLGIGVSGLVVLQTIKDRHPTMQTILMSGDVESIQAYNPSKQPTMYLSKPFRMERLVGLLG